MAEKISRRSFVGAAGFSAAAMMAAGTASAEPAYSTSLRAADPALIAWEDESDVVIIGGGGTGYCAAIEAAQAGCKVLILEKNSFVGGNSKLCGGVILAAGWSPDNGITARVGDLAADSAEAFADQMVRWAQGYGDEEMIREACLRSGEVVDWLVSIGRKFDYAEVLPPIWKFDTEADIASRSCWLSEEIDGEIDETGEAHGGTNGHFDALQARLDELDGIRVQLDSEVNHIVRAADGQVIGVSYLDEKGGEHFVKARKGVVIASAGVDNNTEAAKSLGLQQQYYAMVMRDNKLLSDFPHDMYTNTGDGVRMAREIGAELMLSQAVCMQDKHYIGGVAEYYTAVGHESNPYYSYKAEGTIAVNRNGCRFVQEDACWGFVCSEAINEIYANGWQPTDPAAVNNYLICDADHTWQWQLVGADPETDPAIVSADTIEELAEKIGVPADSLVATVERWNGYCETGVDLEFGRRVDFGKIQTPPFFADPMRFSSLGSFAGVKTNIRSEVIDVSGEPIPRLYAGGCAAGGMVNGPFYVGCGWSILNTCVWGLEAGRQVASLADWE